MTKEQIDAVLEQLNRDVALRKRQTDAMKGEIDGLKKAIETIVANAVEEK